MVSVGPSVSDSPSVRYSFTLFPHGDPEASKSFTLVEGWSRAHSGPQATGRARVPVDVSIGPNAYAQVVVYNETGASQQIIAHFLGVAE